MRAHPPRAPCRAPLATAFIDWILLTNRGDEQDWLEQLKNASPEELMGISPEERDKLRMLKKDTMELQAIPAARQCGSPPPKDHAPRPAAPSRRRAHPTCPSQSAVTASVHARPLGTQGVLSRAWSVQQRLQEVTADIAMKEKALEESRKNAEEAKFSVENEVAPLERVLEKVAQPALHHHCRCMRWHARVPSRRPPRHTPLPLLPHRPNSSRRRRRS